MPVESTSGSARACTRLENMRVPSSTRTMQSLASSENMAPTRSSCSSSASRAGPSSSGPSGAVTASTLAATRAVWAAARSLQTGSDSPSIADSASSITFSALATSSSAARASTSTWWVACVRARMSACREGSVSPAPVSDMFWTLQRRDGSTDPESSTSVSASAEGDLCGTSPDAVMTDVTKRVSAAAVGVLRRSSSSPSSASMTSASASPAPPTLPPTPEAAPPPAPEAAPALLGVEQPADAMSSSTSADMALAASMPPHESQSS
mmetsp:Transcript_13139/g.50264  ORF Transcript_13139/g.50264 Transcript_13139/m.50264 type:complete len:266 (+) Transcript_13139:868-1665(+)